MVGGIGSGLNLAAAAARRVAMARRALSSDTEEHEQRLLDVDHLFVCQDTESVLHSGAARRGDHVDHDMAWLFEPVRRVRLDQYP